MRDDDVIRWQRMSRALARSVYHRRAQHAVDVSIIEDLTQVGLEVILRRGEAEPTLQLRMQDAMIDYLSRWLYGVSRTDQSRRVQRGLKPLTADTIATQLSHGHHCSIALATQHRQVIERLWQVITARQLWLWQEQFDSGLQEIPYHVGEAAGLSRTMVSDARVSLKRLARQVIDA